jgi:Glyoxalase-like domain
MAVRFQLVIDCADPDLLARFWAAALGYELEPPPTGACQPR